MSSNLNPCRMLQRMAKAAVQGICAPAAMADRIAAKRQIVGHNPAVGSDPTEAPDL